MAEARMKAIETYLHQHSDRFVQELKEFLRIPSVSAVTAHKGDVRNAGEWVRSQLASFGVTAELIETKGHPIVYGEWLKVPGAPTVLVYGHYDVQPPDPLKEWKS